MQWGALWQITAHGANGMHPAISEISFPFAGTGKHFFRDGTRYPWKTRLQKRQKNILTARANR